MTIVDEACSAANFSMCRYVSDRVCVGTSRSFFSHGVRVASPTTVTLLVVAMLSTNRMISHVKMLCSSVGRKEMLAFFYLYLGSTAMETMLVAARDSLHRLAHLILTTAQMSLHSAAFFSLFVGGITTDMFIGILGIRAATLLKFTTAFYLGGVGTLVFLGLTVGSAEMISVPVFVLNGVFLLLYLILQLRRLRKTGGEVWAYGTLFISLLCFSMSCVLMFVAPRLIAFLTDRYFDNLFFHHFFVLCTFIMIHKYWLSVYNYEVESLQLEV